MFCRLASLRAGWKAAAGFNSLRLRPRLLLTFHVSESIFQISSLPAGAVARPALAGPNPDPATHLVLRRSARWQPGPRGAHERLAKARAVRRLGSLRVQGNRDR